MNPAEIILRPWMDQDLDTLVTLANNPRIARYMTDQFPHPYTVEHGKMFLAMAGSQYPLNIMAIERAGLLAGSIGIHPQHDIMKKNGELGYWIGEPYWGTGAATAAVRQMVNYVFKNFDLDRVFARPFGTNFASQKVLERAGFKLEAKLEATITKNGETLDELVYARRRRDWHAGL